MTLHNRGLAYVLVGMWIRPEHKHRGLGGKLIDAGFDWVRKHGVKEISGDHTNILWLLVHPFSEIAIALYEKMGFKRISFVGTSLRRIWKSAYMDTSSASVT
jgi:GNAT superfamily N-acetyltransferase